MSNGIASGVPPADGGAGGVAGAVVCARVGELSTAMAQAARVIETIERITSSRLVFVLVPGTVNIGAIPAPESKGRPRSVPAIGDARGLQAAVRLLFRGRDEDPGAGLD